MGTGGPKKRQEVDSDFFRAFNPLPPPPQSRCSGGTNPTNLKGVKKDSKYCRWQHAISWVSYIRTTIILKIENLRDSKYKRFKIKKVIQLIFLEKECEGR